MVAAGAGSGKTRVLVERFVTQVQRGCPTEQILALTFTDQAASEMKERILMRVGGALESDLAVLTFHRFCGRLLREHAVQAGIDPALAILAESSVKQRLRELLTEEFHATQDPQLLRLLRETQWTDLVDNAIACYQKEREQTMSLAEWATRTETVAQSLRAGHWQRFVQLMEQLAALQDAGTVKAAGTLKKMRVMLDAWSHVPLEQEATPSPEWQAALQTICAEVSLTVAQVAKPLFAEFAFYKKDQLWRELLVDETQATRTALLQLIQRVQERYQRLKTERGWCDFADLQQRTYQLLRDHAEVRQRYGSRFTHVLVDEYQDTSPLQQAILELLEQGRREAGVAGTLFMVGDPRQSIYRFRGADVRGFRYVKEALGASDEYVQLMDNFRATESLQACVEVVNGALFTEEWAVPKQRPDHVECAAAVDVVVPRCRDEETAVEAEARCLAAHLRQMGPACWGETAMLLQTRTHLADYCHALRTHGVPYVVWEEAAFWARQDVQDFLQVLRLLQEPEDTVSLLGYLRGPLVGMSELMLFEVASSEGLGVGFWRGDTRWSAEVQEKVQLAQHQLAHWRAQLQQRRLGDWLHHLLYVEGVEARIGGRSLRSFVTLADEAEQWGVVELGELLAWLWRLEVTEERVGGPVEAAEGAVRIMTIHASKGLEFPIVCLPDLTHRQVLRMDRFHLCEVGGLVLKRSVEGEKKGLPSLAYAQAADLERAALLEERKRLLYVGITRAQEKLILSGAAGQFTDKQSLEACSNWWDWLPHLFPQLREWSGGSGELVERGFRLRVVQDEADVEVTAESRVVADHRFLGTPTNPSRLDMKITSQRAWNVTELVTHWLGEAPEPTAPASQLWSFLPHQPGSLYAHQWGQVVHAVFEHLRGDHTDEQIRQHLIPAALASLGIAQEQTSAHVWDKLHPDIQRYRESALFREQVEAQVHHRELPFTIHVPPSLSISGVIDSIWLRPDGGATLVDFKTTQCRTEDEVEALRSRYELQVQCYALLAERLLGWRIDRVGLFLTAHGRWVEVPYDEELARGIWERLMGHDSHQLKPLRKKNIEREHVEPLPTTSPR